MVLKVPRALDVLLLHSKDHNKRLRTGVGGGGRGLKVRLEVFNCIFPPQRSSSGL